VYEGLAMVFSPSRSFSFFLILKMRGHQQLFTRNIICILSVIILIHLVSTVSTEVSYKEESCEETMASKGVSILLSYRWREAFSH